MIPVDADGRPLGPAIVWLDNRATAEARALEERFGRTAVYDVTGVPAVIPTWTACKLLWWRAPRSGPLRRAPTGSSSSRTSSSTG